MFNNSEEFASNFLAHYGVKGMKWGVRNNDRSSGGGRKQLTGAAAAKVNETRDKLKKDIAERTSTETTVRAKPGSIVRVVGGVKREAHSDAVNARIAEQIAKKSTLDALSNQQLQQLVNRMNLEAQYRNLAVKETRASAGERFLQGALAKDGDKIFAKLGKLAPVGKQLAESALTGNKALAGGIVKGDNDKKK